MYDFNGMIRSNGTLTPLRMPSSVWKKVLLRRNDTFFFNGRNIKAVAKKLGFGVIEVTFEEIK